MASSSKQKDRRKRRWQKYNYEEDDDDKWQTPHDIDVAEEPQRELEYECHCRLGRMHDAMKKRATRCRPEDRVRSIHDEDHHPQNGQWDASDGFYCEAHKKCHCVKVSFVRNTRDVDLLVVYRDGERLYWTML
jgi:hypothetical protein